MKLLNQLRSCSFVILALSTAAATAADAAKITKEEVRATISGKTLTFVAPNGVTVRAFYQSNGILMGRSGTNIESSGEWTVDDDGKICQKIRKGPLPDRCYFLMRAVDKFSLSPDGSAAGTPVTVD